MNDSEGKLLGEIEDTFEGYFAARDFVNSAPKMSRNEFEDALMEKVLAVHGGDLLKLTPREMMAANTTFAFFLNRWLKLQIRGSEADILIAIEDQTKKTIDPDGIIIDNRNIIELSLREMDLSSLPGTFGGFSHLKKLDLASNNLTALPDSFSLLIKLELLDLANNKFQKHPEVLNDLSSLVSANFKGNPCYIPAERNYPKSSIEYAFQVAQAKVIPKFEIIDILDIEETILGMGLRCRADVGARAELGYPQIGLKSLSNHLYISYFSVRFANTKKFHFLENFAKCTELIHFNICCNQIKSFNIAVLRNSKKLHDIVLSENLIQSIDLSPIGILPQLEELDLSSNRIKVVDLQPIVKAQNLMDFSLGGNPIEELDISPIFHCPSLIWLRLSSPPKFLSDPLQRQQVSPIKKVIFPSPPPAGHHPDLQIHCDFETEVVYDPKYYQVTDIPNRYRIFTVKPRA